MVDAVYMVPTGGPIAKMVGMAIGWWTVATGMLFCIHQVNQVKALP